MTPSPLALALPGGRPSRAASAVVILAFAGSLAACTAPDAGAPDAALEATLSAADGAGDGGTDGTTADGATAGAADDGAAASQQIATATGADGSTITVSAAAPEMLAAVPVEIPLVAGDADLVQTVGPADAVRAYSVIITAPGAPSAVYASLAPSFAEAGFAQEGGAAPTADGAPAAAVFASAAYRVSVGIVPAGAASSTVTYAIVPSAG